jgi:hypothetical protein
MSVVSPHPQTISSPHPDDFATKLALRVTGAMMMSWGMLCAIVPEFAKQNVPLFNNSMLDLRFFGWLMILVGSRNFTAMFGTYAMQRKTLQFYQIGLIGMIVLYALGSRSSELNAENQLKSLWSAGFSVAKLLLSIWACYGYKRGQGTQAMVSEPDLPMSPESGVKTFLRMHYTANMIWGLAHVVVPEALQQYTVIGHSQIIGMRVVGCLFILWALADLAAIRSEYADQRRALITTVMGISANTFLLYTTMPTMSPKDERYQLVMPNIVVMVGAVACGASLLAFGKEPSKAKVA